MAKPILISGIQPTGKIHLGNYLGALKNFVDLQNSNKYQCLFFIADYHSLTESYTPEEKQKQILDLTATYLASGLNPKKSTIFLQSDVPATTELAWILSTLTPFGELRRMTQFKDKSSNEEDGVNVGLFTYPILMAADILLYDAKFVPVGDDQLQHLELTRTLARKFNSRFPARRSLGVGGDKTFFEPQPILTKTPRLMSLDNPTKKMSKSSPEGCIFIDDHPALIDAKIKKAVTDSGSAIRFNEKDKPGISNLLTLMSDLSGKSINELESVFAGQNYGEFKHAVADTVIDYFHKFREHKLERIKKPKKLLEILKSGQKKAAALATAKMKIIKKRIGVAI